MTITLMEFGNIIAIFFPTLYAKKISNLTPIRYIFQNDPLSIFVGFFFCRFPHSRHLKRRE